MEMVIKVNKKMEITIKTTKKQELIDVTSKIESLINIKNGICNLFVPHTTSAITINENSDPEVKSDILEFLKKIIPENFPYKHSEGNSPAHIASSLIGPSLTIPIENGGLKLGRWQGITFVEMDGPRTRKIIITQS